MSNLSRLPRQKRDYLLKVSGLPLAHQKSLVATCPQRLKLVTQPEREDRHHRAS